MEWLMTINQAKRGSTSAHHGTGWRMCCRTISQRKKHPWARGSMITTNSPCRNLRRHHPGSACGTGRDLTVQIIKYQAHNTNLQRVLTCKTIWILPIRNNIVHTDRNSTLSTIVCLKELHQVRLITICLYYWTKKVNMLVQLNLIRPIGPCRMKKESCLSKKMFLDQVGMILATIMKCCTKDELFFE